MCSVHSLKNHQTNLPVLNQYQSVCEMCHFKDVHYEHPSADQTKYASGCLHPEVRRQPQIIDPIMGLKRYIPMHAADRTATREEIQSSPIPWCKNINSKGDCDLFKEATWKTKLWRWWNEPTPTEW